VRYPEKQKAETHEKILKAAARSFRERGSDSEGIGGVMKELGLTKGGFYRHFESKGDLYTKSLSQAFIEVAERMRQVAESAPKGQELRAIIEHYLSVEHVNNPGCGCVLATLGPDISRQPAAVRKKLNQQMHVYRDAFAPYFPGRNIEEKRARFAVLFSSMAGVVIAARALMDKRDRERLLTAARSWFIQSFAGEK
jgi:TetR/AcrR family transcriptional repressor of nem operon